MSETNKLNWSIGQEGNQQEFAKPPVIFYPKLIKGVLELAPLCTVMITYLADSSGRH